MRPLIWILLGIVVAVAGQSIAGEYVNQYGNSLDYQRGYGSQPGQPNYRDGNGTTNFPPRQSSSNHPCY
jgi:hypothetical protein